MADFYGALSSTSFRVKDVAAFIADPDVQRIRKHATSEDGGFFDGPFDDEQASAHDKPGYWAFGWYGQYPSTILQWFDDDDEEIELDICDVIQRHIRPGDVCRIGVSGNEKLRYIGGPLCWVTSKGSTYFDGTTAWDHVVTTGELRADTRRLSRSITKITRRK